MTDLQARVQALADDQRSRHRYWHVTDERRGSLCVLVSPAMTQAEFELDHKGCDCRPMTDEEIAKWIAG